MEANEDSELRELLREWQAPPVPASLEGRVLGGRRSWWRVCIPVPLPVACALALLFVAVMWRWTKASSPEREHTVVKHELTFDELKPVSELKLRIVRHRDGKN